MGLLSFYAATNARSEEGDLEDRFLVLEHRVNELEKEVEVLKGK